MKRSIPFIMFLLASLGSQAFEQQLQFSSLYFPSFNPNRSFGFSAMLNFRNEDFGIGAGSEFRTVPWGNQLATNVHYERIFYNEGKSVLSGRGLLQLGLALTRDKPLLVYAGGFYLDYQYALSSRWSVKTSLGYRQTKCPGYQKYSTYYYGILEGQVNVGLVMKLGRETSS